MQGKLQVRTVLVIAAAVLASASHAESDFPIADVEGKCQRMMRQQPFIGECIRREQPAYDYSRTLWNDLSEESKAQARAWENRQPGPPTIQANPAYYQNLAQAIEIELAKQRQKSPQPRFRY